MNSSFMNTFALPPTQPLRECEGTGCHKDIRDGPGIQSRRPSGPAGDMAHEGQPTECVHLGPWARGRLTRPVWLGNLRGFFRHERLVGGLRSARHCTVAEQGCGGARDSRKAWKQRTMHSATRGTLGHMHRVFAPPTPAATAARRPGKPRQVPPPKVPATGCAPAAFPV